MTTSDQGLSFPRYIRTHQFLDSYIQPFERLGYEAEYGGIYHNEHGIAERQGSKCRKLAGVN